MRHLNNIQLQQLAEFNATMPRFEHKLLRTAALYLLGAAAVIIWWLT